MPGGAPRLLADRLTDRLEETRGEALVRKPFGWLIGRGLVRRPSCSDRRCDDGTRLDTGAECENCGNVVHIRRARRAKTAAQIERELSHLGDDERRRVLEERLREQAAVEADYRQDQSPAVHMVIFPIGQSRCLIGTPSPARKKFLAADVEPAEVCGHYWV
ncbi:hypothetical protein ACFWB3_10490 [[Kitasatospora] papulosa]|uniref:hypothetical protein n=1 Tax=[Kitasatospora] papulosa TaxID=1464011 RepID=UPI0036A779AF